MRRRRRCAARSCARCSLARAQRRASSSSARGARRSCRPEVVVVGHAASPGRLSRSNRFAIVRWTIPGVQEFADSVEARARAPCRASSGFAAAGERPAERDLVGVLEVAADGQAAREPRDAHARRAAARRRTAPSPRRSSSGSSPARPRAARRPPARRGPAARRCAGARGRRRRSARARRRARGRGRGTRPCARSGRCPRAPRRRRSASGRGADRSRIGRAAPRLRLKHSVQKPTRSLTTRIASASASASSGGHAQEVERQPLCRALSHARQTCELRHQRVDRRGQHVSRSPASRARRARP